MRRPSRAEIRTASTRPGHVDVSRFRPSTSLPRHGSAVLVGGVVDTARALAPPAYSATERLDWRGESPSAGPREPASRTHTTHTHAQHTQHTHTHTQHTHTHARSQTHV